MKKLKAMYYINQFFAGIGGEEKAGVGLTIHEGLKGPAIGIGKYWNEEMEVVKVISCGDNFSKFAEKLSKIFGFCYRTQLSYKNVHLKIN